MARGKFIVIEGGDGTGKSSCKEYLQEKLAGENVIFTHEPGGTEIGQEIRETLLRRHNQAVPFNNLTELLLFVASRAQHVDELIRPKLYAGTHVICDRFAASSFAYQIRANEREDLNHIFTILHELALGETQPDLYILLDLDPKVAEKRMDQRGEKTRFDARALDYHLRVREGMLEYVKKFHHVIIDASQPIDSVKEQVWRAVGPELTK